jgi:hypothetical protein
MKLTGPTATATGSEFPATGAKRIYHQTFSTRKLGLDMVAAKRLAKAERDRLIQALGAPRLPKKVNRRFKPKRRVGVYTAKLLA